MDVPGVKKEIRYVYSVDQFIAFNNIFLSFIKWSDLMMNICVEHSSEKSKKSKDMQ